MGENILEHRASKGSKSRSKKLLFYFRFRSAVSFGFDYKLSTGFLSMVEIVSHLLFNLGFQSSFDI